MAGRRVVVTGVGAVSPLGLTAAETWQGLIEGRSGIRRIEGFDPSELPVQIAGEVRGFSIGDWVDAKTARQMARFAQFAVAAAGMALQDGRLEPGSIDPGAGAVIMGTGAGGMATILETQELAQRRGLMRVSPFFMTTFPHNLPAYHIAQTFRLLGPSLTVSTACATGAQAIGEAAHVIRQGLAEVALAGGTEHAVFPLFVASFAVQRAASTRNDEPERASRPFDADRDGFVIGEGAAVLLLESEEHALARGATIYAEVAGYGSSNDGYHPIAPDPEGRGAVRAIMAALADAGIAPEAVDYVNAHAAGTPLGDRAETLAIKQALGPRAAQVPVSSAKSMIGHLMGAAGAMEALATVLTIRDQLIHPTINYETPDPECDLDYVPNTARRATVRVALSNSFGLGGQNACLVFRRYEPAE
ncbi:MAG: beta-ketoacyl-ACP synthase II [Sphaerobacter sp.]|nr:beta-ketoacyl-ACP synthase II [Sphaerobacter sp.]